MASTAERHPSDDEPFAALGFKIATDPFVGNLTFFRVYSGVLNSGDTVFNPVKGKKERIGPYRSDAFEQPRGNQGSARRRHCRRDWTQGCHHRVIRLCDPEHQITLERMEFPDPVISVAVEPKTKADQEKMGIALGKLAQEDPSFQRQNRRGIRPDHHFRHGRTAPGDYRRPSEARIQCRGQRG